jgi:hypothetical protein
MADPITVWRSKYALVAGIKEMEVWDDGDGYGRTRGTYDSLKFGRDIHLTREEAVASACEARDKKLASLEKQIAKLRALNFSPLEASVSTPSQMGGN